MIGSILIQTSIEFNEDDWHVGRFKLLADHLRSAGFLVSTRDRKPDHTGNDPHLAVKDLRQYYTQIWLICVDKGEGFTPMEVENINLFWSKGGGVLTTRDHQDLGCSLIAMGRLGAAHNFHDHRPEPNKDRHKNDDVNTQGIEWPNYHSGDNGSTQVIIPVEPLHELLKYPGSDRVIRRIPSHPHEGCITIPPGASNAQVVALGVSQLTGNQFNIAIAFEKTPEGKGRVLSESSFHHFVDFNWFPNAGAPSIVEESPSNHVVMKPELLEDVKQYVVNAANWLQPA